MSEKHVKEFNIKMLATTLGVALALGFTLFAEGMFTGNILKVITGLAIIISVAGFYFTAKRKINYLK